MCESKAAYRPMQYGRTLIARGLRGRNTYTLAKCAAREIHLKGSILMTGRARNPTFVRRALARPSIRARMRAATRFVQIVHVFYIHCNNFFTQYKLL